MDTAQAGVEILGWQLTFHSASAKHQHDQLTPRLPLVVGQGFWAMAEASATSTVMGACPPDHEPGWSIFVLPFTNP